MTVNEARGTIGVAVGERAPDFWLPAAQGGEVGLVDYRGRRNVIVWFTKGMGCVFCRQHMSQLARAYPEFVRRQTEVLEITPTPVARARVYARKYRLPFPYLCDEDDSVRRAWQLGIRSHGPVWYAKAVAFGLTHGKPANDFGQEMAPLAEIPKVLRDDDAGLFLVDRGGIVRYAYAGSYVTVDGGETAIRPLPPLDEVVRELDRLAA